MACQRNICNIVWHANEINCFFITCQHISKTRSRQGVVGEYVHGNGTYTKFLGMPMECIPYSLACQWNIYHIPWHANGIYTVFAISGPPRGWETMPFSWKEMWLSKWGHNLAIHQSTHPWNKAWRESLLNKAPAASPRKKPVPTHGKDAGAGAASKVDPKGKARGATIPVSNSASRHAANIAVEQPCEADTCDIFPCLNSILSIENTTPKEAYWLKEDRLARALNRDACLGLYASREVAPHTWIASFGPLLWSRKGDDIMVANGHVGQNGYRMYFCNALTPLGYKAAWGTPRRGWQGKHHAPLINHTCCKVHCNTRYVADEEATTFNVITTQHVADGAKFLANYVQGFARPHSACFENLFSQKCKCCTCTQRTVLCAP